MQRACDFCGVTYLAKAPQSRFCSSACRTRNHRAGGVVPQAPAQPSDPQGDIEAASLRELTAAGRVETSAGQRALMLARLLDDPPAPFMASLAGWSRQHGAAMAEACKDAKPAQDSKLDQLRARRDAKRRA